MKLDSNSLNAVKDLLLKIAKGEAVGSINGDADALKEMILDEDKEFTVELIIDVLAEVDADEEELINNALKSNSEVVNYYDVTVVLKANGEEVATISELENSIAFALLIDAELPAVKDGYQREFYVVRIHDYSGTKKAEIIAATLNGEEVNTSSNKFSTFALAYVDTEIPVEPEVPENPSNSPKTGDNFMVWVSILVISGISLVVISKCTAGKRKNKHAK